MKFSEKKTQTLLALYDRKFDGKLYDIRELLGILGISIDHSEAFQIGKSLDDEGYILFAGSKDGASAEINANGVEYVEEFDFFGKPYDPVDPFNANEKSEIISRLSDLSEEISKLRKGQELIYDDLNEEIEELKELVSVLGKKNWGEIFKGKLVSWGLGELSEKAFELIDVTLTNKHLPS